MREYRFPFIVGGIILTVWVMSWTSGGKMPSPPEPAKKTASAEKSGWQNFLDLGPEYMGHHAQFADRYWLVGNEDPGTHIVRVNTWATHTRELMDEVKGVSPLAEQIYANFNNFVVTEFRDGLTVSIKTGDDARAMLENPGPEMVVVPIIQMERYGHLFPALLFYKQDWRAVSIVGIEIPDTFRAALLYHELGHALRHQEGAASATAPSDSDSFIWEEMEMHELEHNVLDVLSGGELALLYGSIRSRAKDPTDPESVIAAVTADDLVHYDQIMDIDRAGPNMSGIYASQFFLGLAIDTVNANKRSDGRAQKIAFYRWLTDESATKRHAVAMQ